MAPDPPVLSQSESKIWLDYELCVYDQSTNSGRLLVGTTIEVVGMKKRNLVGQETMPSIVSPLYLFLLNLQLNSSKIPLHQMKGW